MADEHLEARVVCLERELKRARRWRRVALAVGAVALLVGAKRSPRLVQADRVEILDPDGAARLVLSAEDGAPHLRLTTADRAITLGVEGLVTNGGAVVPLAPDADEPDGDAEQSPAPAAEPTPEGQGTVSLELVRGPWSFVEVKCDTGYRERSSLRSGRAEFEAIPPDAYCKAMFKGGGAGMGKLQVRPGRAYSCGQFLNTILDCREVPPGRD